MIALETASTFITMYVLMLETRENFNAEFVGTAGHIRVGSTLTL